MPQTEMQSGSETGCCPRFEPGPWEDKELVMEGRPFVKDRVRCLFHIPLDFGGVMKRNMERIQAADAVDPDLLILSDANSLWGSDVYISVAKEVPGADNVHLSGRFLTHVYEGPYKDVRKWCLQMQEQVKAKGEKLRRMLYYYTTCPRCAKVYGKNYVVLLAEVGD